jgi:predicted permease
MARALRARLRSFVRRVPVDVEVDEELAFHIESQIRRYVAAGMSPLEARSAALSRFGDLQHVRDACRTIGHQMEDEMQRAEMWHELRQDVGYGMRTLRRAPLFTSLALLTLAIGIGASTAIFSLVHAVLLRALPYPEAGRMVVIWNHYANGLSQAAIAPAEYADIREQQQSFDGVAALTLRHANLAAECAGGGSCEPERVTVYAASPNVFDLLGVRPAVGRSFTDDDAAPSPPVTVVISEALWRRRFGADPSIIGRPLRVNGVARTVIGVMPPGMRFPDVPVGFLNEPADMWLPTDWMRNRSESRGNQYLGVIARMRPGLPTTRAQADLDVIANRFRAQFSDRYVKWSPGWSLVAVPLHDQMFGDVRPALLLLLGAVSLVLLIACANVANLMLARAAMRHRELAIRSALGAGRGRLVRQLLTESGLLAFAGSALGVAVAAVAVRLLVRLDPGNIPRLAAARVDLPVLAFAIGAGALTGLLVGIVPALQHSRARGEVALAERVGSAGRGATAGSPRRRLRNLLVVAEVGMALVVLPGAGLLVRSFVALQRVTTGFDGAGTLAFQVTLPGAKYDSGSKVVAFYDRLTERERANPGVDGSIRCR